MPNINKEENMKEGLLIALALLMGLFLLLASIVCAAAGYAYERGLFTEKNNAKVIFQTRSPFDRRRVKDRRLFFKQEYLNHNPERRSIMIRRRTLRDRRELVPIILNNSF